MDYNEKYKIIKKYVDEYDYYALLAQGCPNDEFDTYSRIFADKITENYSVEDIAILMANTMNPQFGEPVEPHNYIKIATKIKDELYK